MFQLIKQVLKSFKNSVLLLFGLVFISFAIVFASTSSIYFSSNILNSYNTLTDKSNAEDAITPLDSSSLNNNNIADSIYDLNLNLVMSNGDILSPADGTGLYFANEDEYRNRTTSFMYQPAKLSYLNVPYIENKNNYFFPFYVAPTNGEQANNNNPFFTAKGINDEKTMYATRAKGILKSYNNVEIPTDPAKWRAWGYRFGSDPKNIVYQVNPYTGLTVAPDSEFHKIKSIGYFSNGLFETDMPINGGNMKYPQSVEKYSGSVSNDSSNYQVQIGPNDNSLLKTPFFISGTSWDTDINFDINQFGSNTVESIAKILQMINAGADAFNVLSSLAVNTNQFVPLGDLDWNLVNINFMGDLIDALHDPKYMTEAKTSSFAQNVTEPAAEPVSKDQNDYVFNIHLDESKLTNLQKQTLNYLKTTNPSEYDELTRFVYPVSTKDIKQEFINQAGSEKKDEVDKLNLDNLEDFKKEITVGTDENNQSATKISGWTVTQGWIAKYANEKQKEFFTKIEELESEYLASLLVENKDIAFNIQKSTTITDSNTSNKILVSQKDTPEYKGMSPDVNNLYVSKGILLQNSTKYLDVMDTIFKPINIPNSKIPVNSAGYSLNEKGDYLINLINLIAKSDIVGIPRTDTQYQLSKQKANKLINDYQSVGAIDPNDYYFVLSLISPILTEKNKGVLVSSNQNITLNIIVKNGSSSITYYGSIEYATPYGYGAIVTEKWLNDNSKSLISADEWKKAVNMDSPEFFDWVNALPDKYKLKINGRTFVLLGVGQSAENAFPIVSLDKPIPNTKTESLVFVNKQGYDSIISTNPIIYQDKYFAIKFINKKIINDKNLDTINQTFNGLLNKKTYLASDTENNKNLLTLRYSYPKIINGYVQIFSLIFMILLILIGIYLSYLMIKIYVDKNQVSLAIIKANGFSSWKIILALSVFGLFVAILSGTVGYLATFFLQPVLLSVLSNYWYLPISLHNFSVIGFIGGGLSIYLAFTFFVFIGVMLLFKNPINNLITKNTDFKINKLSYILKSSKLKMPVISKFTTSLVLNKVGKFSLFVILCSLGISIISVAVSTSTKFNVSQVSTNDNRKYSYKFDLTTPTEQSGLYKIQDYAYLGTTDENLGINSVYESIKNSYTWQTSDPYNQLWKTLPSDTAPNNENNRDLFALRNLDGTIKEFGPNKEKRYYANIILPSYSANSFIKEDINFLRNAIFTKWLLDFNINVVSFSLNAWDFVKSTLSPELVVRVESISNDFVNKILSIPELAEANRIGSGTAENPKPFLTLQNGVYKLTSDNVITNIDVSNLSSIRLNNQLMKFIGMVYGNEELSNADTKIAYGIVPKNNDVETYTYLNGTMNNSDRSIPGIFNNGNKKLENIDAQIVGINPNSTFVTLVDKNNNNLNNLLTSKTNDGYYPVVINEGAGLKYNLSVGSTFKYTPTNTYDRYTQKLMDNSKLDSYDFKVVGLSTDSFDVAFYTSQYFANEMLKMNFDQGATIVENLNRIDGSHNNPPDTTKFVFEVIGDESKIYNSNNATDASKYPYPVKVTNYKNITENFGYVPFNGIFSREENPLFLNTLTIQSLSGMWGNFNSFSNSSFDNITTNTRTFLLFDSIIPFDTDRVTKLRDYLMSDEYKGGKYKNYSKTDNIREDVINIYLKEYPTMNTVVRSFMDSIFGTNSLTVSINNFEFFKSIFGTYVTIFDTFILIQNLVIVILVPIIIIIVMIISSVMINEFKKMFMILKTLGYSDSTNLKIVYITFLPVLVISILIAMGLVFALLVSMQTIMFNLASIFLSSFIDWLPFLYASIAIIAIMLVNFVYISIYMKKQNLRNTINDN